LVSTCNSDGKPEAVLEFHYPSGHPINKLVRHIRPEGTKLFFALTVYPAKSINIPIGLHPTFSVGPTHSIHFKPGKFSFGLTFPGMLEPSSILASNHKFLNLEKVQTLKGETIDISKFPLSLNTENLVQLCGIDGHFEFVNSYLGYTVKLSWNKDHFPSALLWLSNRGRPAFPWNGEFEAIGIEPVCSAFDLGEVVSTSSNPINKENIGTSIHFKENSPWTTEYSIEII